MAVVSLSLDQEILERARQRAENLGFKSFSAYVQAVVRSDLLDEGPMQMRDAPSSTARDLVDAAAAAAVQRAAAGKPAAAPVRYKLTPAQRRKDSRKRAATSGNP